MSRFGGIPIEEQQANRFGGIPVEDPVDFDTLTMLGNVPSSAVNYGKNIASAVMNPDDTVKAMGALVADLVQSVYNYDKGEDEPLVGTAKAVNEWGVNRYGSTDAFKQTLMDDPVGVMADMAAIVSPASMAGVPGASKVVNALEPAGLAARGLSKAVSKGTKAAYSSAAKFQKGQHYTPERRGRWVDTALDSGVSPSFAGAERLQKIIDKYNAKVGEMISSAGDKKIPTERLMKHLGDVRRERDKFGMGSTEAVKYIDDAIDDLRRQIADKGKQYMSPKEVQEFKIKTYKDINFDARHSTGTPIKEEVYKAVARAAKDELEAVAPGIKAANQKLGDLYDLQPRLTQAANRVEDLNLVSIDTPTKGGLGYMIGDVMGAPGAGLAAGTLASVLGRPKIKSRLAIGAHKLAEPMRSAGSAIDRLNPAEIRLIEALAGRAVESGYGAQ